jgi:hypothetical protein
MTTRLFNLREKLETARLLQLFAAGDARGCRTMQEWLDQHIYSPRVQDYAATIVRITTHTTNLGRLSARDAPADRPRTQAQCFVYRRRMEDSD